MNGGVYLFDKPEGLTSREASTLVARSWGYAKRGHCGTLDPAATGVLPVLLGSATRLSPYLTAGSKVYSFTLVLGITTETDDLEGRVTGEADASGITADMVIEALGKLSGSITQTAPLYSAVRVDGVRAYRSARSGMNPAMPSRAITAEEWCVGALCGNRVRLSVRVSAGTYIRALARDAGRLLGVGGAATEIVRESSGGFERSECSRDVNSPGAFLTMAGAMRGYPSMVLTGAEAEGILHGIAVAGAFEGTVAILSEDGRLLAVGRGSNGTVHPACVLERP